MSESSLRTGDREDEDSDRDPLEALASEFAERYRRGDDVTVDEYVGRHPSLAGEIRNLFPTIVAMECLTTKRARDAAMAHDKPKQLGDYLIVEEVARGGMGIVYEAEQISLGRRVAVKVLPSHYLSRLKDIQRFHREAHTAASLHHSNIVPVFGVGEENGQHYIVMQLIRGVGLDEVLNEIKRVFVEGNSPSHQATSTHRMGQIVRSASNLVESALETRSATIEANIDTVETPRQATTSVRSQLRPTPLRAPLGKAYFENVAKIGKQAAEALNYAHDHDTLHRDIKPGNLILDQDGRIWVADFGLAKAVQDQDVTRSGDLVGTIAYVAPERFQGTTTKASDVYSLGVTLHEMLTLQKAFRSDDRVEVLNQVTTHGLPRPSRLNRGVPRDLETIVMKATSSDPSDRYSSAGLLANDLAAFLDDRPISARRMSYFEHGTRWCRRNKLLTTMAFAMAGLVVAAMASLAAGMHHARQQRANAERSAARAERSEARAVGVIEEIYDYFAPDRHASALGDDLIEDELSDGFTREHTPISKNTAAMLENLVDYYDELAADAPDSEAITAKAISANRRVGDIHRRLDQLEDARSSYERAIRKLEQLPAQLRDTPHMRLESARIYNGRGLARDWRRIRERAHDHREAVNVLDPNSDLSEELFQLATSLYLLHRAERHRQHREKKHQDPARNVNREEAKSILNRLLSKSPDNADYNLLLARCLLAGSSNRSDSQRDSVADDGQQGINILNRLVVDHPENPDFQFELGQALLFRSHWGRGDNEKQLTDAETQLRAALSATENLEVHHPNIPEYYRLKKNLHECLGRVLAKTARLKQAIVHYDHSERLQHLLIAHAEHPAIHEYFLLKLQLDMGQLFYEAGELDRSGEALLQCATGFERLIHHGHEERYFSRHDENRSRLELAYRRLAKVAQAAGDEGASQNWQRKADDLE